MTLRIITGTIIDARDPFGVMQRLYKRGIFTRWRLTEHGWEQIPTRIFSGLNGSPKFSIIQTTGSGKTVLAVLYAYQAHSRGAKVGGNLSLRWTKNNEGRQKKDWEPTIQCMEDFQNAKFIHIIFDDIRGTIKMWNADEAFLVSETANATRKNEDWVDITTQRLKFVPPDIRDITDEIIVPYIRCVDGTQKAPDGRDVPLEIIAFKFSAGKELLSYSIYNLAGQTGKHILDSFNTLQKAEKLKQDAASGPRTYQPGYELEVKAFEFLKEVAPGMNWQHLNGKYVFDIISDTHAIDVCGTDPDGRAIIEHKDLLKHMRTAKGKGQKPYLMLEFGGEWGFVPITYDLNDRVGGKRVAFHYNSVKRISSVLGKG